MKRALFAACVLLMLIGQVGCQNSRCNTCRHGRGGHGGGRAVGTHAGRVGPGVNPDYVARMRHKEYHESHSAGAAGPTTGAVAYPYYTTRGPRDFFIDNPPTIGH